MTRPARRPSQRGAPRPDPIGPSTETLSRGGAFAEVPQPHFERGFVIDVDAARHVYRVALSSGRTMVMARLRAHPNDHELLPIQTPVLVNFSLGAPYIHGVLPFETVQPNGSEPVHAVTDTVGHGGEDPMLDRPYGANARSAGEPRDLLPGDFVRQSPDGATVGAMHGRVALLKGSPLAQVRAFGDTDTVEIIAGLLRLVTWMGESRYVNDEGKTSFIWRGGADQLSQTGADEERYTVRLDVGQAGDLLKLQVTTPDGQPKFVFHVDSSGRLEITAAGGIVQTSGSAGSDHHPQRFWGTQAVEVEGPRQTRVSGQVDEVFEGNRQTTVAQNDTLTIGQDHVERINRDRDVSIGGGYSCRTTGNWHTSTSGDVDHDVRGPGKHHKTSTVGGDIIEEPTGGKFKVNTTNADAIELGGTGAAYHAVRFETLESLLQSLQTDLNTFKNTYATHTHVVTGTAGPFPVAGNTVPTTSQPTPTSLTTQPLKSTNVKIG